jgi:hypothetical protein
LAGSDITHRMALKVQSGTQVAAQGVFRYPLMAVNRHCRSQAAHTQRRGETFEQIQLLYVTMEANSFKLGRYPLAGSGTLH